MSESETKEPELIIPEKMQELKKWSENHSLMPDLSKREITLFLHSCDYNIENTKKTLVSYFKLRIKSPDIFSNRNPSSKEILASSTFGYSILLPGSTNDGYKVIMVGYCHSDTTNFTFLGMIKRFLMTMDMWLSKIDICPGIVVLIDCKNSSMGHATSASLDVLKVVISYFQEAFPVKLVGFYFINMAPAMSFLLSLVQPFLSKRIINMIHRIPKGYESLYKLIPKQILPLNYGGEAGTIQELHNAVNHELIDHADWFREEDKRIRLLAEQNSVTLKSNTAEKSFD